MDAPRLSVGGKIIPIDAGRTLTVRYTSAAVKGPNSGETWFGPLSPMRPVAPSSVIGRRMDYQAGYNAQTQPRDYDVPFSRLRSLADTYDTLRMVIETRKDQMARLKFAIRPIEGQDDKAEKLDGKIQEITAFLRRPDRRLFWNQWLREVLEDLLVIDAPTLWKQRNRGGKLIGLEIIDGATIAPKIDGSGRVPRTGTAYQQVLKGIPAADYNAEDIIYMPRNRRPHTIYGYSPVQQILMTVNIALRRQLWQLQYFTEGNIPDALIGVPDGWGPEQIAIFQDWFDNLNAGDTSERRKARFVPGDAAKNFKPTKADNEMFGRAEEWLARVTCFAFGVDPTPFIHQPNRATAESAAVEALKDGLAPIQTWVKNLIDTVILDDFGCEDLEFVWQDDATKDPKALSDIIVNETAAGLITINEARAEKGMKALDGEWFNTPMVKTSVGYVPVKPPAQSDGMGNMMDFKGEDLGPPPPPEVPPGMPGGPVGGPSGAEEGLDGGSAGDKTAPDAAADAAGASGGGGATSDASATEDEELTAPDIFKAQLDALITYTPREAMTALAKAARANPRPRDARGRFVRSATLVKDALTDKARGAMRRHREPNDEKGVHERPEWRDILNDGLLDRGQRRRADAGAIVVPTRGPVKLPKGSDGTGAEDAYIVDPNDPAKTAAQIASAKRKAKRKAAGQTTH